MQWVMTGLVPVIPAGWRRRFGERHGPTDVVDRDKPAHDEGARTRGVKPRGFAPPATKIGRASPTRPTGRRLR
jgi:hypothetical protein